MFEQPWRAGVVAIVLLLTLPMGAAQAVRLSASDQGQVLIYPYYTVRNGHATLLSLTNNTQWVKAVNLKFLEGKGGSPALDFHVYLGPQDSWTAALLDDGQTARLLTNDASCTVPTIPLDGIDFRPFAYQFDVYEDDSVDRAREGMVVAIEMAELAAMDDQLGTLTLPGNRDCGALVSAWSPGGVWMDDPSLDTRPPGGGLSGHQTLIQVERAYTVQTPALALNQFRDTALHLAPGEVSPNLGDVQPPVSEVFSEGRWIQSTWSEHPVQAVSAVLNAYRLRNDFVFDAITDSFTDWVLAQPTRAQHVSPFGEATLAPFGDQLASADGQCQIGAKLAFDRDGEQRFAICPTQAQAGANRGSSKTSPCPPIRGACWATTIASRGDLTVPSPVLGSSLRYGLGSPPNNQHENGWASLEYSRPHQQMTSDEGHVHHGLPVIGFALTTYNNGVFDQALRAYGTGRSHQVSPWVDDGLD